MWWEAVLGYLTATIEWAKMIGQPDAWKEFWYDKSSNVKIYNFIGKDNILFHTVLWQGILLGMGQVGEPWDKSPTEASTRAADGASSPVRTGEGMKLNLPYDVPANMYLNLGGQKFSKSLGVSVDAIDLVEKYGADPVRFYLSTILPETKDADWNWNDFAQRNNSELLAKWGNLAQRTLSQIWKNFDQQDADARGID